MCLGQPLTIGYAKNNDIILNNLKGYAGISRYHSTITLEEGIDGMFTIHINDISYLSGLIAIVDNKQKPYIKVSNGQFNFNSSFNKGGPIDVKAISHMSVAIDTYKPIILTTVPAIIAVYPNVIKYEELKPNFYRVYNFSIDTDKIPPEEKLSLSMSIENYEYFCISSRQNICLKVPNIDELLKPKKEFKWVQLNHDNFKTHRKKLNSSNAIERHNFLKKHGESSQWNLKIKPIIDDIYPLNRPWFYVKKDWSLDAFTGQQLISPQNSPSHMLIEFFKLDPTDTEIEHLFFVHCNLLEYAKNNYESIVKSLDQEWVKKILEPLIEKHHIYLQKKQHRPCSIF